MATLAAAASQQNPIQQAYASMEQIHRDIRTCHNRIPEEVLGHLQKQANKIHQEIILTRSLLQSSPQNAQASQQLALLADDYDTLQIRINIAARKIMQIAENGTVYYPESRSLHFKNIPTISFEEARWMETDPTQSYKPPISAAHASPSAPIVTHDFVTNFTPAGFQTPAPAPSKDAPECKPSEPFNIGKRVGIHRQGMNCWANSLLQFMRHIPSVYNFIHEPRNNFKVLVDFYKAYNSAADGTVARSADSQLVRKWLSERTNYAEDHRGRRLQGISPKSSVQEDASEGLLSILNDFPKVPLHLLRPTQANGQQVNREEAASVCTINVRDEQGRILKDTPLDELFVKKYLWGQNETRKFYEPPCELFLHINRNEQWPSTRKIDDALNIPLRITIPARSVIVNESCTLECDAILFHRGSSMTSGHYVAYRKINGKWYEFDDSVVTEKTEAQIRVLIKKGYVLHYVRVKA